MSERDDELLRLYGHLPREVPPAALDASILAASRRATRKPLARWAAPFSVAAVLVLALGLVLKVQREAPEVTMPPQSSGAPSVPATSPAPAPGAAGEPAPGAAPERHAAAKRAESGITHEEKKQARVPAFVPEPPAVQQAPASSADLAAAREENAARSSDSVTKMNAAPAATKVAPSPPQIVVPASTAPPPAPAPAPAPAPQSRAQGARAVAAPYASDRAKDADPVVRELERIAELREHGKDDEADAALEAFRRAHPDYRIEPAMWEKVRRR